MEGILRPERVLYLRRAIDYPSCPQLPRCKIQRPNPKANSFLDRLTLYNKEVEMSGPMLQRVERELSVGSGRRRRRTVIGWTMVAAGGLLFFTGLAPHPTDHRLLALTWPGTIGLAMVIIGFFSLPE